MTKFVGLFTATLLALLGTQVGPILGSVAFVWAGLHFLAVLKAWYDNPA